MLGPLHDDLPDAAGGCVDDDDVAAFHEKRLAQKITRSHALQQRRRGDVERNASGSFTARASLTTCASAYAPIGPEQYATRSPCLKRVTLAPTASTTPAPSWPRPLRQRHLVQAGAMIRVDEVHADGFVAHADLVRARRRRLDVDEHAAPLVRRSVRCGSPSSCLTRSALVSTGSSARVCASRAHSRAVRRSRRVRALQATSSTATLRASSAAARAKRAALTGRRSGRHAPRRRARRAPRPASASACSAPSHATIRERSTPRCSSASRSPLADRRVDHRVRRHAAPRAKRRPRCR